MTPELKQQMIKHSKAHLYYLHLDTWDKLYLINEFTREFPLLKPTEVYLVEFIKLKGLTELAAC